MEILIISLLIFVAIILFLTELFIIPGISIAGIASIACLGYANYYAFTVAGTFIGTITMCISIIGCIIGICWFMRSKTLDRLSLKENIKSKVDSLKSETLQIGAVGISTTRLAQIGYADFDGRIIEVKAADGLIEEQTPIIIKRIDDGTIYVTKQIN